MSDLNYGRIRDLGRLPELLRSIAGDKGVVEAFRDQGLPVSLLGSPNAVVPMRDLIALNHRASQISGIRSFGLEASSSTSITDRGIFGAYMTQAPTLLEALMRVQKISPYFESGSEISIELAGDEIVLGYRHHLQGVNGWRHVAAFKFALAVDLIKFYLGDDWRPDRLETSFSGGLWEQDYEDFFGAPIRFGEDRSALVLPRELADTPRPANIPRVPPVAFADIVRLGSALPRDFVHVVGNLLDRRLCSGATDLEGAAWALGLGPRTVQRRLSEHGLNYRELLLRHRMGRACNLLAEPEFSVAQISREVGYASAPQFIRAFKSSVGTAPMEYRKTVVIGAEA